MYTYTLIYRHPTNPTPGIEPGGRKRARIATRTARNILPTIQVIQLIKITRTSLKYPFCDRFSQCGGKIV